jgi:hypothetical protein
MSEICVVCQRPVNQRPFYASEDFICGSEEECYRLGYKREQARADRFEAEFSACKALLIAAEGRAEEAERRAREWNETADKYTLKWDAELVARAAAEQRASEARDLALREAAELCDETGPGYYPWLAQRIRDLAALPVEPARCTNCGEPEHHGVCAKILKQQEIQTPSPTGDT